MSAVVKYLSVIIISLYYTPPVMADYEEFLEKMKIEEMFRTLGPSGLISTFCNHLNSKNSSDGACSRDLISYAIGIKKEESWAVKSKYLYTFT